MIKIYEKAQKKNQLTNKNISKSDIKYDDLPIPHGTNLKFSPVTTFNI